MHEYSPFQSWSPASPYALALGLTTLLCVVLLIRGWRYRAQAGGLQLMLMTAFTAIWVLFYSLELATPSLNGKVFWAKAEYLGIAFIPVAWFVFARAYTGAAKRMNRWLLALLCVVPVTTVVLVATNGHHGWVWSEILLYTSSPFPNLHLTHGPWFWVNIIYSYALLGAGDILLLRNAYSSPRAFRGGVTVLLLATLAPWIGNAMSLAWSVPAGGLDVTPFAFALTAVVLLLATTRLRLFSLFPALLRVARIQVLETMADAVMVLDLEGRVVSSNPAARHLFGAQAPDLTGVSLVELLGDRMPLPDGTTAPGDLQFEITLGKNGSGRHFDVVSSPLGLGIGYGMGRLLVLRDVTERRRAEEALRESQKRLQDLIFLVGDWIWETDTEYRYTECSEGVRAVLGYSPEEVLGKAHWDFARADEAPALREYALERREKDQSCSELVSHNLHRDGHEVVLQSSCVPVFNESGALVGYRGVDKDVTATTVARESLRASVLELNALWQIASTVAGPENLTVALQTAAEQIAQTLEARVIAVETFGDDGETLLMVGAGKGGTSESDEIALQSASGYFEALARLVEGGTPVVINDLAGGALSRSMLQQTQILGLSRLLVVPLILQAKAIGAVTVARGQGCPLFSEREVGFVQSAASTVAAAIVHARLREDENEKTAAQVREHLARELHDAVTQSVYSANLIAQALPAIWERDRAEGLANLAQIQRLVRSALAELRILLYELRPATLVGVGLDQLFEKLGDSIAGQANVQMSIETRLEQDLPLDVKRALYRIAQEAFNNISKHARATSVRAGVISDAQGVTIEIEDDGVGFDMSAVPGGHMGLGIMRERAEEIGAEFDVQSIHPTGTRVIVRWARPRTFEEQIEVETAPGRRRQRVAG